MFIAIAALAASETSSWLQTIMTSGSSLGLGALAWWLMTKQIPKLYADARTERDVIAANYRTEREAERQQYLHALERRDARLDAMIDKQHEIAGQYYASATKVAATLEDIQNRLEKMNTPPPR